MRALILDDSRAMRVILKKILVQIGFEVLEAADGTQGLTALAQNGDLDVVLVDWNMPGMNGYEFVQAVRSERAYDKIPLLMVTTETEMDQVEKAMQAGANEYIMKPFTRDAMIEKLEQLGIEA